MTLSEIPQIPQIPPSIGLVGGKYELVKMIGRGGMGSVWEARHVSLGTPSAIKFIEAEYVGSQEARSRFDREAKAAATIQSKHAIQIYDHGVTDDGKPYIVMELLTGEPLDKRIDRLGALTLQDTARILQQVARGLSRAHERGIIHRDLKPENVFIVRNTDDDDEIAKVLDFGIAKIQSSAQGPAVTSSTKTGAILGTPFYMSPEQARGLRNVDHRTDVWSLGVIAFKCVTGQLPFDGESVGDLLVKICTAPIPLPSHVVPGLPHAFDVWFVRALEREPERRFANVLELADHLAFAAGIGMRGPANSNPLDPRAHPHVHAPIPATVVAPSDGARPAQAPRGPMGSQADAHGNDASISVHPGAMTAAPFTSSQRLERTSAARGKWRIGAALMGIVFAAGAAALALKIRGQHASAASVGVTQSPPSDKSAPPALVEIPARHVDPASIAALSPLETRETREMVEAPHPSGAGGVSPGAKPSAKPPVSPVGKPPGLKPPSGVPVATVPPLPAPASPTAVVTIPVAAPVTPPPAPSRKANKNDPGY